MFKWAESRDDVGLKPQVGPSQIYVPSTRNFSMVNKFGTLKPKSDVSLGIPSFFTAFKK